MTIAANAPPDTSASATAGEPAARVAAPRIEATPLATAAARAADVIEAGGLVALPTETVYGLAADAASTEAVARLFAAKGRPSTNPLIVHVAALTDAAAFADIAAAAPLADLWPGPLTLVLPLVRPGAIAPGALAGGMTVAVRVPAAPLFRAVAARVGPIVAPSANRSGCVSATTAAAVAEEFGARVDLIVDGGPCPIGIESTVVDMTGPPRLLRPGAIPAAVLEARLGPLATGHDAGPLRSPGLLASHYAPRARLRLGVTAADVRADEAWLALGDEPSAAPEARTVRLSRSGDLDEAARHLYEGLRRLDTTGAAVIAVSPIPDRGVGAAIIDRLRRAAAPRPDRDERSR